MLEIKTATQVLLEPLAELLDLYRQFYQMPSSISECKTFLLQRFAQQDSVILVAFQAQQAAAFLQVYPIFSSVALKPVWVLNDLYVKPLFRRQGIARQLMLAIESTAKQHQVFSIKLATALDNQQAQQLYDSLGYVKIDQFHHYSKRL
ncbi:GNAT family N-acetyltransferase [Aliikangiella maris]|uniref:GNAT family N-acetyltransferase n=2 Tax=Aliikangiella maris TaxID=3162458 RepID=A0ABV3MUA4_9GAMM